MRKICVVTGSRAEYGLLRPVIDGLRKARGAELQLVVTGAHLSPEFGLTYREIEEDGFEIRERVEMLLSADTPSAVTKSMALAPSGSQMCSPASGRIFSSCSATDTRCSSRPSRQ